MALLYKVENAPQSVQIIIIVINVQKEILDLDLWFIDWQVQQYVEMLCSTV